MALTPGTRLGPYEILAPLGAGGMGEVYRARDGQLNRDVALKVLPELFALDLDRLARFKREAQVLASLNHPNIAAIYGFEQSTPSSGAGQATVQALVLELVEGPTLADRIAHGPLPVDEALPIARQIAEALEAAHEQGVIHRDLKPANIKLRPDGTVKVLDFGLAKALASDATGAAASELALSPTITTPAATRIGVILGTAAYMSPEQARGQTVGHQADIWAFGVVLYEMLTARQAFPGETVTDILSGIVRADPEWTALPATTPPHVRLLLRHCLQKNRAARLHHIGDARIDIDVALSDPSAATTSTPRPVAQSRRPIAWIAAALLLLGGAGLALLIERYVRPVSSTIGSVSFAVRAPEKASFPNGPNAPYVSISPDGRQLAFIASSDGAARVWVRSLDTLEARPLPATEGVLPYPPFWSPDSRFIGYFTQGKLKKIALAGGPGQTVCDVVTQNAPAGTWNRDDVIVFAGGEGPLRRVSAAGGEPQPVTTLNQSRQEERHHWPYFLPDGDHFFFLAISSANENNGIFVGSLSSNETKIVSNASSRMAYDPAGYLLFVRDRTLMALPFDARKLQATGDAVPIAEHVRYNPTGQASLTVSGNGVLAYRTGNLDGNQLTWFDRSGKALGALGSVGTYLNPELSPDEKQAAIEKIDQQTQNADVWVIEVARGVMTRLTFAGIRPGAMNPVWSPTGEQIVFNASQNQAVSRKPSGGAGSEELLFKFQGSIHDWSSDGKFVIGGDLHSVSVLPVLGDRQPFSYLPTSNFTRAQARLSSDGRWMAYRSNESGREEIYVQSFPTPSVKSRISTEGGHSPRWRRDGKELFYLTPDQKVMAVSLRMTEKAAEISTPAFLFDIRVPGRFDLRQQYDVTGDGQRFLVNSLVDESETPITVVLNWTAVLKK